MGIQGKIDWLQTALLKIRDERFLETIKYLVEEKLSSVNDIPLTDDQYIEELGCTVGEYNKELEEAEREVRKGNFYTQEDVEKMLGL